MCRVVNLSVCLDRRAHLEEPEHLVVGVSGEHDLAGVELVDRRAEAPEVEVEVVLEAENDLGRAVEPGHEVGRDIGAEKHQIHINLSLCTRNSKNLLVAI